MNGTPMRRASYGESRDATTDWDRKDCQVGQAISGAVAGALPSGQ
jgi:hypothetical protein